MPTLIRPPRPRETRPPQPDTLADCVGYRVDDPNGRVGTVDGVAAGAWSDRPDGVEVRVGLFRPAILMVPAEAVVRVDPARRRVVLRACVDLDDAHVPERAEW